MFLLRLGRCALGIVGAAAMLTGCGGSPPINPAITLASPKRGPDKQRHYEVFRFVGKEQYFTVPNGVTEVSITADGGTGGGDDSSGYGNNGRGGRVRASIPVTPGETLYVFVGGVGNFDGGWNGGGYGGLGAYYYCSGSTCAWGGGGASDVRQGGDQLANRVVVAGGGGGQSVQYVSGGSGGPGISGYCASGSGESGGLGQGGFGGFSCLWNDSGAGGGGGYYGGGGGGGTGTPSNSSRSGYGGAAPTGNGRIVIAWH
jgi:hypothetical protein